MHRMSESWLYPIQAKGLIASTLAMTLILFLDTPTWAQGLEGNEVRELALRGTWASKDTNWGYWSWYQDNTVCVRLFGPEEDCADTGAWDIEGEALCYELTWFGEAYGVRENCFTVKVLGENHFESRYYGGALESKFFEFSVIE